MSEQEPEPTRSEEELISRPDPTFKAITDRVARAVGLKIIGAELPQTLSADFVLEAPPEVKLENTLFEFLANYQYAVVDFKGQSDPLDIPKLQLSVARTALFSAKHPQVSVRQILNLLVSSRFPQEILKREKGVAGFRRSKEQPWLWRGSFRFQEIAIVVCRDLPLEPRFYDWLAFVPSDNRRWPETIKMFLEEERFDLLTMMMRMHPKEFKAMQLDLNYKEILSQMDPKERERLDKDTLEFIKDELRERALKNPESFKDALSSVEPEKVVEALTPDQLADALSDEQLEEILRRRRLKNKQSDQN